MVESAHCFSFRDFNLYIFRAILSGFSVSSNEYRCGVVHVHLSKYRRQTIKQIFDFLKIANYVCPSRSQSSCVPRHTAHSIEKSIHRLRERKREFSECDVAIVFIYLFLFLFSISVWVSVSNFAFVFIG